MTTIGKATTVALLIINRINVSLENHRATNMVMLGTLVICAGMGTRAYFREEEEKKDLQVTADLVKEKVQKELSLVKSPNTKCVMYEETDRNKVQCDAISNICHTRIKCILDCLKSDGGFDKCCGKVEEISPKSACEAERVKEK